MKKGEEESPSVSINLRESQHFLEQQVDVDRKKMGLSRPGYYRYAVRMLVRMPYSGEVCQ